MSFLNSLKIEVKKHLENDATHDFNHIMRVYKNAQEICKKEKANKKLVLASVLLHDLVLYPKSDKKSKNSSFESAKKAEEILKKYSLSQEEINIISEAIKDHSFSQNKIPQSIEGKILQDADRLDALGAIGIVRVFATGGSLNRSFYNPHDPFCTKRKPNDTIWTIDHFFKKLFKLESLMNTKSGKIEAKKRTKVLKNFLNQLKDEI